MTIKEDPGARRARVFRRMGEGLGAGGTPPGITYPTRHVSGRFLATKLFSRGRAAARSAAARTGSLRGVARQFHLTAVRKFEISQVDAKATLGPGATFNDVACSNREPTGKTIDKRTHGTLLRGTPPAWFQCQISATVPRQAGDRDGFL